ncbi:putative endonuclease [Rhizobium esperanzae]|uniref:Putative endonuclease n=3 Tax=Rhizobium TaxID=379 RepID=A0A7W6R0V0_9HYPH|nr:putative endonuclease [Rhizobium esperanzae]
MPDTFEMIFREVGMVWRSRSVVDERLEFCRLAGLKHLGNTSRPLPWLQKSPHSPSSQGLTLGSTAKHSAGMAGYVYIVTNQKNGTLYIGVTSDLERRIYEHREGLTPGFAWKYGCTRLVWYEEHWDIGTAIQREKSMKRWNRQWKIDLVEAMNPEWDDLYLTLW